MCHLISGVVQVESSFISRFILVFSAMSQCFMCKPVAATRYYATIGEQTTHAHHACVKKSLVFKAGRFTELVNAYI